MEALGMVSREMAAAWLLPITTCITVSDVIVSNSKVVVIILGQLYCTGT